MDRRRFLQGLSSVAVLFPLNPILAASPSFKDFKKQQSDGFANYQAELEQDFANYQKAIDEEFGKFKGQVKKVWGDEKIGSSKVLVQYSDDLKTRTIIDFEKGTMTVELVAAENAEGMGSKVRQALVDSAGASVKEAYDQDPLLQKLEKRLNTEVANQEKDNAKREPVISDVLTGKANPTKQQLEASVVQAAQQGTATTRSTP